MTNQQLKAIPQRERERERERERVFCIFTSTFHFLFSVPARIIESASSKDTYVKEGRDVTLWCNATGIPEPNITWFRINMYHGPVRQRKSKDQRKTVQHHKVTIFIIFEHISVGQLFWGGGFSLENDRTPENTCA